jgi:hypothetical protein
MQCQRVVLGGSVRVAAQTPRHVEYRCEQSTRRGGLLHYVGRPPTIGPESTPIGRTRGIARQKGFEHWRATARRGEGIELCVRGRADTPAVATRGVQLGRLEVGFTVTRRRWFVVVAVIVGVRRPGA